MHGTSKEYYEYIIHSWNLFGILRSMLILYAYIYNKHSMDTTLGVASMRTSSHCSDIMKGRKKEKNCDCPPPPLPLCGRTGGNPKQGRTLCIIL